MNGAQRKWIAAGIGLALLGFAVLGLLADRHFMVGGRGRSGESVADAAARYRAYMEALTRPALPKVEAPTRAVQPKDLPSD